MKSRMLIALLLCCFGARGMKGSSQARQDSSHTSHKIEEGFKRPSEDGSSVSVAELRPVLEAMRQDASTKMAEALEKIIKKRENGLVSEGKSNLVKKGLDDCGGDEASFYDGFFDQWWRMNQYELLVQSIDLNESYSKMEFHDDVTRNQLHKKSESWTKHRIWLEEQKKDYDGANQATQSKIVQSILNKMPSSSEMIFPQSLPVETMQAQKSPQPQLAQAVLNPAVSVQSFEDQNLTDIAPVEAFNSGKVDQQRITLDGCEQRAKDINASDGIDVQNSIAQLLVGDHAEGQALPDVNAAEGLIDHDQERQKTDVQSLADQNLPDISPAEELTGIDLVNQNARAQNVSGPSHQNNWDVISQQSASTAYILQEEVKQSTNPRRETPCKDIQEERKGSGEDASSSVWDLEWNALSQLHTRENRKTILRYALPAIEVLASVSTDHVHLPDLLGPVLDQSMRKRGLDLTERGPFSDFVHKVFVCCAGFRVDIDLLKWAMERLYNEAYVLQKKIDFLGEQHACIIGEGKVDGDKCDAVNKKWGAIQAIQKTIEHKQAAQLQQIKSDPSKQWVNSRALPTSVQKPAEEEAAAKKTPHNQD